jgi:hypothetical protein
MIRAVAGDKRERGRQQQRHRADRADAGQDADDRADEDAHEAGEDIGRRQRDAEPVEQPFERVHSNRRGRDAPSDTSPVRAA